MAYNNGGKKYGGSGGGRKFGGRDSGGRGGFGGDRGEKPTMHPATCDKCGKACEVPFKPMGSKPVYCKDCFVKPTDSFSDRSDNRDSGKSFRPGKSYNSGNSYNSGDNFKPAFVKPDQSKQQFEILNVKLDKIMKMLSSALTADTDQYEPIESDEELEEIVKPKAKKKAKKDRD